MKPAVLGLLLLMMNGCDPGELHKAREVATAFRPLHPVQLADGRECAIHKVESVFGFSGGHGFRVFYAPPPGAAADSLDAIAAEAVNRLVSEHDLGGATWVEAVYDDVLVTAGPAFFKARRTTRLVPAPGGTWIVERSSSRNYGCSFGLF